jgi:addiction module HigA family antidote
MTNVLKNEYQPDYVSPPGETLLETLETIGMSQAELAKRMARPIKTINEIVQGKAAITAETALQLEQVLSIPASFWINREQNYREALARLAKDERLKTWVDWLKEIPVQDMIRLGWIPKAASKSLQVLEVLKFFGVASPDAWQAIWESENVAYHKSTALKNNFGAITAWLREGELEGQKVECNPYNAEAFRNTLTNIRALTVESVDFFQQELVRLCANAGVVVVFVKALPNTRTCGATRWLTPTKALIQLSLRYKTNDQFWFTFFHEAGHILLHGKRLVFLETEQNDSEKEEKEADKFASDTLISREQWKQFIAQKSYRTKTGIEEFAQKIGIASGIVVGRLQHEELLPFTHCNQLKRTLKWADEVISNS